jgi:hypothetical protein
VQGLISLEQNMKNIPNILLMLVDKMQRNPLIYFTHISNNFQIISGTCKGLFYLAPWGAALFVLAPPLEIFTKNMEISPKIRRFRNSRYLAGISSRSCTKHPTSTKPCFMIDIQDKGKA